MKVIFIEGVNSSLDSVRGIGVHTKGLIDELEKINRNEVEVVSDQKKADTIHYTKFHPFFISLPFKKPAQRVVLTIHDLIQLIYPKHYPPGLRGKINLLINKFLVKRNVDAIITISETSKKDICRFLGIDPKKVFVTYLAPKEVYKKLDNVKYSGLPKNFALYIGDVNYNKNIPNLIKACEIAKIPLVIAGKQAAEVKNLNLNHPELIHLKGLDWSNVKCLGFVNDSNLARIINLAKVYVQPSFYEGFGLPPLEALACGIPVVASRTQCLVEVLGDAATYFNPFDPIDMAKKIKLAKLNGDLPREYTWNNTAQETLNVYKSL